VASIPKATPVPTDRTESFEAFFQDHHADLFGALYLITRNRTARNSRRRTCSESWLRGFGARSRTGLDHDSAPLEPDRSALGPHKTAPGGRSCKKPPVGPDALICANA